MPEDKRLPRPPKTPFGRGHNRDADDSLTADEMSMAMAEGRLDEYMKKRFGGNEGAMKLAGMMMGVTPGAAPAASPKEPGQAPDALDDVRKLGDDKIIQPPDDVVRAAMSGDVSGLMEFFRAAHAARMEEGSSQDAPSQKPPQAEKPARPSAQGTEPAMFDRPDMDQLIRIAAENGVSVDWLIARAIKLYIKEHRETGRL